ncbi:hypothetical protein [Spiroplasma endosymbiont of Polydrusus pterygomalis]|uniref:hypothetical protein n=1 Tax=Spiroplasma endosymbiont of Polydrusus pterygomalis TaxID=3139327 RepID=UPI003CCB28BD
MSKRRLQISILIFTITIMLIIMLFFIVKNFSISSNLNQMVEKYDVKVETVDDKKENLGPEIIKDAIDISTLNKSIVIRLDKNNTIFGDEPQIMYKIQFNQNLFQYLFLKLIIKTFPQWKINDFIFHFNALNNAVWVEYNTNLKSDYLEWYFKITSKI